VSVVLVNISGDVTLNGSNLSGVTVNLTGTSTGSTTTAGGGATNYSFGGLGAGSYTVTPVLVGYTFSPTNISGITASTTTANFAATPVFIPQAGAFLVGL
jgi:hypothetical protein